MRQLTGNGNLIFMLNSLHVGQRVTNGDVGCVFPQSVIDVYHLRITDIRTVLLEGNTQNQYTGILHQHAFFVHQLDDLISHVLTHRVIQSAGTHHDTRPYAIDLCSLYQIIGIDADAVTSHQSWREFNEIPLRRSSLDDIVGINAHDVKHPGQLVHKGYVHVTLRVLNNLGSLGHLDAGCLVCSVDQYRVVHAVYQVCNLWSRTRSDLPDFLDSMQFVTGIDTFRRIAGKEIR